MFKAEKNSDQSGKKNLGKTKSSTSNRMLSPAFKIQVENAWQEYKAGKVVTAEVLDKRYGL